MTNQEIGQLIRNRRTELHISIRELSATIGVSKSALSRWETGQVDTMKVWMINSLAAALYLPTSLFISGEGDIEDPEIVKEKIAIKGLIDSIQDRPTLAAIKGFVETIKDWK